MARLTTIVSGLALGFVSALTAGCSSPFASDFNPSAIGANNSEAVKTTWSSLDLSGLISGGRFDQFAAVSLNKSSKTVTLTLPVPATPYLVSAASFSATAFTGASFAVSQQADGSSAFALTVPLSSFINGVKVGTSAALPTGVSLPGVSGGKMPALAVTLPNITKTTATLYSAAGQIGIYVSTAFDPTLALTYPIKSADGSHTWGSWTTVPATSTVNGGYFILLAPSADILTVLSAGL